MMENQKFIPSQPIHLSLKNIRLEPMTFDHIDGLTLACQDGELWKLRVTSAPHFSDVKSYMQTAFDAQQNGQRIPFVVIDELTNTVIGTTSYYDMDESIQRLEIGYTWYRKSYQRSHVNTTCKFLLLQYAFEQLKAKTVAIRTDHFNFASQKAIERLGAKKDGVIRGQAIRRDGTIRDTVMYSIIQCEWENVKANLLYLLNDKYPKN